MPISVGIVGYEMAQHERVQALIAAVGGPVKAAALLRKSRTHIDNMRKPDARLSLDDLLPLCIEAGISLDWVATGYQTRPDIAGAAGEAPGMMMLRPLLPQAGAELRLPDQLLARHVDQQHARFAVTEDDGMAPLIAKGALVVVDARSAPLRNGLYLVGLDGELVARRLNKLPGNTVELVAEGAKSWRFEFSGATRPDVLYRIVWHGQAG